MTISFEKVVLIVVTNMKLFFSIYFPKDDDTPLGWRIVFSVVIPMVVSIIIVILLN